MSTLLEVKDVCKRYGKKTALDHLNLTLESGHIVGPVSYTHLSSRCIKTECSGRGIETGFCNYRSNCNCIPVLKEEGSVCQTEERSTEEIKRQYASGGSKYKGNGR